MIIRGASTLILATLLISALIILSIAVTNNPVPSLDRQLTDWITDWDLPGLRAFLVGTAGLTSTLGATVMGLAGIAIFVVLGRTAEAKAFAIVGVIIGVSGYFGDDILAEVIGRDRAAAATPGHNFPSGHAWGATAFFGLWIFIFLNQNIDIKIKAPVVGFLIFMILAVGTARVYENIHWPSDIAAGYLLGSLWLLILIPLFNYLRQKMGD